MGTDVKKTRKWDAKKEVIDDHEESIEALEAIEVLKTWFRR